MKTKLATKLIKGLVCWLVMLAASVVHGQFTASYQTNTITAANSTNYPGPYYTVGYGGPSVGYSFDVLQVIGGGGLTNADGYIGVYTSGTNNLALVDGNNSLWKSTGILYVGYDGTGNQLIITNGGVVQTTGAIPRIGDQATAAGNSVVVSGSNSLWNASGQQLWVGNSGSDNQLTITDGGRVVNTYGMVGTFASANNNKVLVSGNGSVWSNTQSALVGRTGSGNRLTISNGAQVVSLNEGYVGTFAGANNNQTVVTGSNSLWSVGAGTVLYVGYTNSVGNQLVIQDSGQVLSGGGGWVGYSAGASNNSVVISGNGSWSVAGLMIIGYGGSGNQLIVTNGGKALTPGALGELGRQAGANNNTALISGNGSVWSNASALNVGNGGSYNQLVVSNGGSVIALSVTVGSGPSATGNTVRIQSTGLLDANVLTANNDPASYGNTITNDGGIFQFSITGPTITPNTARGGAIVLTNGVISFRNISDANVKGNWSYQLTPITFLGDNAFRLNAASNTSTLVNQDYTFNTGLGATNYTQLQLMGNGSLWRSSVLTIGSGGSMLVSNSTAQVDASFISTGTVRVVNSRMTFGSNVVISGSYLSDPSTNAFLADVTVTPGGTLAGGAGDLFDFTKSLIIHSTNRTGFNLATSAVRFSGGGMHTNAITGADLGTNQDAFVAAFVTQTNFAYGELHLGSADDQVCFTCGNQPGVPSNGLYVGWLDLLGNASLVTNLHAASGINIYYSINDPRNSYLGEQTYQLTDCNFATGGGFLMPVVPEPSALLLIGVASVFFLRRTLKEIA